MNIKVQVIKLNYLDFYVKVIRPTVILFPHAKHKINFRWINRNFKHKNLI